MSALDGTIPLAQVDDVAVLVAQDLKFDMVRPLDVFLDEDAAVAERGLSFSRRDVNVLPQFLIGANHTQASSPAAGAGLDHDRVVDLMGESQGFVDAGDSAFGAGDDRDACLLGDLSRLYFAAHEVDRLGRRTDKGDAGGLAEPGEFGVFREESVSGMDCVGADALGDFHDLLSVQETFDGARAYEVGLVGFFDVNPGGVGFRIDRRCRDIELTTATDDAHGDFATVGNKDLPKHDGIARGLEP